MDHMNFENMVKNSTKQAIRDMPKITKPSSSANMENNEG
jgi:hypothetical protein